MYRAEGQGSMIANISGLETRKADKDNMQHLLTLAQATRRSLRRKPFCLPVSTCAGVFFRS